MPLYNKIFNKVTNTDTEPVPSSDGQDSSFSKEFDKFNKANLKNRLPATDLNVTQDLTGAYQTAQDLRSKALDKVIEATNLGKLAPGADTSTASQYGRVGLDMVAPDVTDLIPAGKLTKGLGLGVKELKMAPKLEKSAEELAQGIRKADSYDLARGSNLIGQPVFKTAEEKALGFGKVSTPDMGANVGHNEIMKVLNESPAYQKLINNRELFKSSPETYAAQKQMLIDKAREYLIQKAGK